MKKHYFLFILLISFTSIAQVGIGTSDPKATLDIVAKPDDLSRIDGVIAPRMTGEQLKLKDPLYTLDQTGAIVYVTETPISSSAKTVNITSSGYYYFDGTVWVALKKDVEVPDYNDGAVRMALAVVNPQNSGAVGAFAVASFRFPTATKIDTNLIQQNSPTVFQVNKAGYYSFSFYGVLLSPSNQGGTGSVRIRLLRNGGATNPGVTSIGYGAGSTNMNLGLSIVLLLREGDRFEFQGSYTRAITLGSCNLGVVYLGE